MADWSGSRVGCVMKRIGVALTSSVLLLTSPAFAAAPTSASGSGNTLVNGELRSFSFVVQEWPDGTVSGTAQINNRAIDEMFQLDLDCLQVAKDIAVMSGVFTRHTDAHVIGFTGIFGVLDNGEGSTASPDAISQVFILPPGTLTCQDIDPDENRDVLVPIVSGNIQVR
jgi:hypothetical protein